MTKPASIMLVKRHPLDGFSEFERSILACPRVDSVRRPRVIEVEGVAIGVKPIGQRVDRGALTTGKRNG